MSEIGLIKQIVKSGRDVQMIVLNNRQFDNLCAELFTNEISGVNLKLKSLNLPPVAIINY